MDKKLLDVIEKNYELKQSETDSLGIFKVKGMKFVTTHYDAPGLGSVSVMKASGMLGLMEMTTLIVNPFEVDAPLISYDSIRVAGKNILYLEMFNTCLEEGFDNSKLEEIEKANRFLPNHELGEHWYDSMRVGTPVCKEGKKTVKASMDEMCLKYFEAYIKAAKKSRPCDKAAKKKKAAEYSEGLLKNGGPATDPVKAQLGEEKAAAFFRRILFAKE